MKKLTVILLALVTYSTFSISAQEVKWYTIEEAIELNKKEPRKIMVDVYTDWCGWCKVMDKKTFSNQFVSNYLNEKYYSVKFNAESKDSVKVNNTTFRYVEQGNRGYNEFAVALLNGQLSYPSVVFLTPEIQILHVQKGFTEAKAFDELINFIGGDHFKTASMESWLTGYKSPVVPEVVK